MYKGIDKLIRADIVGKNLEFYDEVGSTNDQMYELVAEGAVEGTVIVAESQTHGRGRLDRVWVSPRGVNIYMSVLLRPEIPAGSAQVMTLIASIALHDVIARYVEDGVFIKWPNDLVINNRKTAGVLTEMHADGDKVDFVVLGIGINVNMERREITALNDTDKKANATSLMVETGNEQDRKLIVAELINSLDHWYLQMDKGGGALIRSEWIKRWGAHNKKVRVSKDQHGYSYEGVAKDIEETGLLIIETTGGYIRKVITGDVSII